MGQWAAESYWHIFLYVSCGPGTSVVENIQGRAYDDYSTVYGSRRVRRLEAESLPGARGSLAHPLHTPLEVGPCATDMGLPQGSPFPRPHRKGFYRLIN